MAQAAGGNDIRRHKRPAEDELDGERRLTKKFELLHIGIRQLTIGLDVVLRLTMNCS
jgi:hypothetical protein